MESVNATTQVVYVQKDRSMDNNGYKSGYDVDIWREVRKRWMVLGVLLAMALAVLAPHFGAPGGNYMHAHVDITRTHCTHLPMRPSHRVRVVRAAVVHLLPRGAHARAREPRARVRAHRAARAGRRVRGVRRHRQRAGRRARPTRHRGSDAGVGVAAVRVAGAVAARGRRDARAGRLQLRLVPRAVASGSSRAVWPYPSASAKTRADNGDDRFRAVHAWHPVTES